jgi:hypothetical protein
MRLLSLDVDPERFKPNSNVKHCVTGLVHMHIYMVSEFTSIVLTMWCCSKLVKIQVAVLVLYQLTLSVHRTRFHDVTPRAATIATIRTASFDLALACHERCFPDILIWKPLKQKLPVRKTLFKTVRPGEHNYTH